MCLLSLWMHCDWISENWKEQKHLFISRLSKSCRVLKVNTDSSELWISFQRKAKMRNWILSRKRAQEALGREMMGKTQEDPSDHVPSSPRSRDAHSRHRLRCLPNPAGRWVPLDITFLYLSVEVISGSDKNKAENYEIKFKLGNSLIVRYKVAVVIVTITWNKVLVTIYEVKMF